MALIKMIKFFPNSEGYHEGDVFEYPDPTTVIKEGLAELASPVPVPAFIAEKVEIPEVKEEKVAEKVKKFFKKGGGKK